MAVARLIRDSTIRMHPPRTYRLTQGILCPGTSAGHVIASVLTPSRVKVMRVNASPGQCLHVEVPAGKAFALAMTMRSPITDAGDVPFGGTTQTFLSNESQGGRIEFPVDHDLIVAHMPEAAFENVPGRWQLAAAPFEPSTREVTDDPAARYLCLALLSRPAADGPLESIFSNSLSLALLTHFLARYCPMRSSRDDEPGIRLEPWQLRIAEETMLARIEQRLPISVVAQRCGISAVHFSRAFRRTTSETPHRWLMRRRLEKACALLVSTDETIADIALACGFSDQSHLTRTFSLLIGTTPASWRALQRDAGVPSAT